MRPWCVAAVAACALASTAWAGTDTPSATLPSESPPSQARIDTAFIEQPWPRQLVRELEVGRYPVRWRQHASHADGLFAGVRFTAPLAQQRVWDLANDYHDIGTMTPGVTSVRFLEQTPTRQVIQVDVKVLWKSLRLTFEVEQVPPQAVRFRLVNKLLGEYRGVCLFEEQPPAANGRPATAVALSTWLKPARPVPIGLLMTVERVILLKGVREFLATCESPPATPPHS